MTSCLSHRPSGESAPTPIDSEFRAPAERALQKLRFFRLGTAATHAPLTQGGSWEENLVAMFDRLDVEQRGVVDKAEVMDAVSMFSGDSARRAVEIIQHADDEKFGIIERTKWLDAISEFSKSKSESEYIRFDNKATWSAAWLGDSISASNWSSWKGPSDGGTQSVWATKQLNPAPNMGKVSPCMLRQGSFARISWDIFILGLLLYISMALPYNIGFVVENSETQNYVDRVIDWLFMLDVVLNFRTGYNTQLGIEVLDSRLVAIRYLKSWFALDVLSSVPVDMISDGFTALRPMKLLKGTKVAKCLKLLKLGKVFKGFETSRESIQSLEDAFWSSQVRNRLRVAGIATCTFLTCHWMACFMAISGPGFLDTYSGDMGTGAPERYLAALYWAMTTITTVGYGDITPDSNGERIYAMLAMVVGGSFYGYIIGSISLLVSTNDLNTRAFCEKMDLVQAWLEHHQLPVHLRRRVRRYFKAYFTTKSALDESAIMNDLSPDLRGDIGKHLIHDCVRHQPLFKDLPSGVLALLVPVLNKVVAEKMDRIVSVKEPGDTMFIIIDGAARKQVPLKGGLGDGTSSTNSAVRRVTDRMENTTLKTGDSFGEEVLLGIVEVYCYSVTALTNMTMFMIPKAGFRPLFENIPDVLHSLKELATENLKCKNVDHIHMKPLNKASLLGGGAATFPPGFATDLFNMLENLQSEIADVKNANGERLANLQTRVAAADLRSLKCFQMLLHELQPGEARGEPGEARGEIHASFVKSVSGPATVSGPAWSERQDAAAEEVAPSDEQRRHWPAAEEAPPTEGDVSDMASSD